MTTCDLGPETLRALAPGIARLDAAEVAVALSPWLDQLRAPIAPGHVKEAVDAASAVCRALFDAGRSVEVLPLARGLLEGCGLSGENDQTRRASGLCGLITVDCSDLVGGIEHHAHALRLAAAEENRLEMGRTWVHIGQAITISQRHELAARCFRRSLALLEPVAGAGNVRFAALGNLADNLYQLGHLEEALASAEAAHRESAAAGGFDPHGEIILRRTLARVLIAQERPDEAVAYVGQAVAIADDSPSPRAAMAVEVMRVAVEMATGKADLALTRLDRTLDRARRVPAILQDALAYAVRAEEAAGHPERALMRLQELCDQIYGHGVERARRMAELAGLEPAEGATERRREEEQARLASMLTSPEPPQSWATLRRLGASAVLRMDDTGWHGVRVGALVKALALKCGSPPLQAAELGLSAELHDIGMGSVPAAILAKQGPLNESERAAVRKHHEGGAAMLVGDRHPRLMMARDIAHYHHARWDGTGYPSQVGGTAIPLGARLCAVADAYDMMVCGFGGRTPLSMEAALFELKREAGGQFDPQLVSCFDALVKGELEALGFDSASEPGMEVFQELILSLKDDRGFV